MSTYHIRTASGDHPLDLAGDDTLVLHRRAGAVSTASWRIAVDSLADDEPLWAYGTPVAVVRDPGPSEEILFQGKISREPVLGSVPLEAYDYEAADAWLDLEMEIFDELRACVDADGTPTTAATSRILLYMDAVGGRLTVAQMCENLAVYAAAIGIGLQPGTFDAPVTPPFDECRDRTLAELILRALKWQPDALPWIDHATVPPTLHVTRRQNMTALTIPYASLGECRLEPRRDLQRPGVIIRFEASNAYGRTIAVQSAGDTDALGVVRMTIPLEFEAGLPGPVQEIKTVPLGDYISIPFWRKMFPWIPESGAVITHAAIDPPQPEGFDNILTGGIITSWMKSGLDLDASTHKVSVDLECFIDGQGFLRKTLSRDFLLTNAQTRRYIGRITPGWSEEPPSGLAAAFYASLSTLQHAGTVSLTENECAAARHALGKRLLITGGLPAWASMIAPVAEVREDFATGESSVTVGPLEHLTPQDMIELIRASRIRTKWAPLSPLDDGTPEEDDTEIDPFAPEDRSAESPGQLKELVITDELEED